MDIAKYIGLFLLKNNFCYIHGLGNLELKRKSAVYDGQALQAPSYDVQLTPGGSIDDNLANFIATAEQISISKAANALRDFSTQAKADLHEGKEVIIPSLGKFVLDEEENVVTFITETGITHVPPSIQATKLSKPAAGEQQLTSTPMPEPEQETVTPEAEDAIFEADDEEDEIEQEPVMEEEAPEAVIPQPEPRIHRQEEVPSQQQELPPANYPPYPEAEGGIHWGRVLMILGIVAIVIIAGIWGIQYINRQEGPPPPIMFPQDTTKAIGTAAPPVQQEPAPVVADTPRTYKMVVNTYPTDVRAQNRVEQLTELGRDVDMTKNADGRYPVYINVVVNTAADTTHIMDSLRRIYNPTGSVYILKD